MLEKVYSKIDAAMESGTSSSTALIDLLQEVNTEDIVQYGILYDIFSRASIAEWIHPSYCHQAVNNGMLFECVLALGLDLGYFAVALAMYCKTKYSLRIDSIPTKESFDKSSGQDVYNELVGNVMELLGVFYD